MTHEEILDNAVLLFFAGIETTKQLTSRRSAGDWKRSSRRPATDETRT